ncbi:hypothetical protein Ssi02_47800 [Sinosporangium siamense]|uniref:Uncharacterized protein n=1 Tax=Sinosporangium siamense TaxID=1367973 RepID=A0A919VDW9_9ACTN|nr:hypothetical protein Ssi02_47800 [Sinosporangium siamense]
MTLWSVVDNTEASRPPVALPVGAVGGGDGRTPVIASSLQCSQCDAEEGIPSRPRPPAPRRASPTAHGEFR